MPFVGISLLHLACMLVTAAQIALSSSDSILGVLCSLCLDVMQTQIIHACQGKKDVALKSSGALPQYREVRDYR